MTIARTCGVLGVGLLSWTLTTTAQSPAAVPATPRTFDTAAQAAESLIAATSTFDVGALESIFGQDGRDLVLTEDSVQDRNRAEDFAKMARERTQLVPAPGNANRITIVVGNDDWPLPIPIVRKSGKWSFDAKAGRDEILNRRVGSNELDAIEVSRGFVEAQHQYALTKHDGSSINQYAQRIISMPGKQDGLAWRTADGAWTGPVGEVVAEAIQEGYFERTEPPKPYHGYFFKVLKGQGPAAPLGRMDYVIKGAMIGGFALAAAPAEYGITGVQTFIVSQNGVVYQKDLGANTLEAFKAMELFNPDKTWTPVFDEP